MKKCLLVIEKQNDKNLSEIQVPSNSANTEKIVSYANAVVTKKPIILQPKDEKQSVVPTKRDLLEKVDPVKSNMGISSVKTGRIGSVITTITLVVLTRMIVVNFRV